MGIIQKQYFQTPSFNRKKANMRFQATVVLLVALASMASATSVIATTGVLGGTAAVLLGAKILALKGFLLGRALGKRDTLAEVFLEASRKDQYDCAKLLICELNAKSAEELKEDELTISRSFGQMDAIDVTAPGVEFDLAGLMGRMVGSQRCKSVYSRCALTPNALMENIRKVAFAKKN